MNKKLISLCLTGSILMGSTTTFATTNTNTSIETTAKSVDKLHIRRAIYRRYNHKQSIASLPLEALYESCNSIQCAIIFQNSVSHFSI